MSIFKTTHVTIDLEQLKDEDLVRLIGACEFELERRSQDSMKEQ